MGLIIFIKSGHYLLSIKLKFDFKIRNSIYS